VRTRNLAVALIAVVLPLGAAGCGSDDGGDSKATTELIAELREEGMTKTQAECIARAFADAELSDDEVDAIRGSDTDAIEDIDAEALQRYARSASLCLGIEVEVPGG
jgi:hypothetical protein